MLYRFGKAETGINEAIQHRFQAGTKHGFRSFRLFFGFRIEINRNKTIHPPIRERGVADLFRLLHEEPQLLRGAFNADKVVGKGAAALMVLGGVEGLFADVVSRPALELLAGAGIAVEYTVVVPNIVNRAGTGTCPVEQLCAGAASAAECLPLIEGFMQKMKERHG